MERRGGSDSLGARAGDGGDGRRRGGSGSDAGRGLGHPGTCCLGGRARGADRAAEGPRRRLAPRRRPAEGSAATASFAYPRDGSVIVTGETRAPRGRRRQGPRLRPRRRRLEHLDLRGRDHGRLRLGACERLGRGPRLRAAASVPAGSPSAGARPAAPHGKALLSDWGLLTISTTRSTGAPRRGQELQRRSVALQVELRGARGLPGRQRDRRRLCAARRRRPAGDPGLGPLPGDQPNCCRPRPARCSAFRRSPRRRSRRARTTSRSTARASYETTTGTPARTSAGSTGSTSSASSASRSLRSPTAPSTRSAGITASGNRLWLRDRRGTSSSTRTCRRSRPSLATAPTSGPGR